MAPLGCCASICQGMTIISSFLNSVGGIALIAVSIIMLASPLSSPAGIKLPCMIAAGLGGVLLLIGIINITGAIKEKRPVVKAMVILIVLMAVALAGVLMFIILSSKKSYDRVKTKYMNEFTGEERNKIHEKFKCCGMDTVADAQMKNPNITTEPEACKYSIPCKKPINRELKKKTQLLIYVNGGVILLQLFAAFAAGCLMRKMRHQHEKEQRKKKHVPLAEQARMSSSNGKKTNKR